MKIYAVEHNLNNLLLVDGNYVINGAYELIFHEDGSAGNCMNNIKSYFVMDVPEAWLKGVKLGRRASSSYHESYIELWDKIDEAVLNLPQ